MQRSTSSTSTVDGPRCRLCWGEETDPDVGGSPLVSPCDCRGSVGLIHVHCLQHWLEVKRQQGASRSRTVRCEVCRARYNTAQLPPGTDCQSLLPRVWSDPYSIAAVLHGAWRAYVVISGLTHAYSIYRNINSAVCMQHNRPGGGSSIRAAAAAARRGRRGAAAIGAGSAGGGGGGAGSIHIGVGPPRPVVAQQQQQQVQQLRHHLSISMPLGGGGGGGGRGGAIASGGGSKTVLATIRERFDKATMVQVYWYTALMALTPTPPNADAFAGMAVGATVGGMVAQLVFLPLLGSGKLAALTCSCQLLLRCMLRLLAAEACQARGFRVLAGLIRGLMQRWQRLRQHRGQQQQQLQNGTAQAGEVAVPQEV